MSMFISKVRVPTIMGKIFEINSSFHVKQHTTAKFNFYFSVVFC